MAKPNLEQYFNECQEKGIFVHAVRATNNGDHVLFVIHPQDTNGETLDFKVYGNRLEQIHISEECDLRNSLLSTLNSASFTMLKEIANFLGYNYK